uniref:C2H2-type domain-containing protein n=1 Tax=Rhabditophanes sp. KR3021 TaxID=114890 RepID=A0AC35UI84_9BILA
MFSNAQNDLANLLMGQQLLTQFKPTSNNLLPSTPDASNMSINPLNLLAMNPFLLNLNVNPNLNQNADKGFGQDLNFNMHSPLSMTPTLNTPLSINAQMNFNSPGTDYNLLAQMLQYQLLQNTLNLPKQDICNNGLLKVEENHNIFASPQITPLTPKGKKRSNMETMNCKEKKSRQMRKLTANDTETNSPVSGMFIKETCDLSAEELQKQADIDDTAAFVDVSLESRAEVAKIQAAHADTPNWPLNESRCALCRVNYQDVFKLAMHRCPRIIHEEYPCPECDKSFACAANLQSHR